MQLSKAKTIADHLVEKLSPHCERIAIAGSVRREKPFVKDIELVCIPQMSSKTRRSSSWCTAVFGLGQIRKGKLAAGKYIQISLPQAIKLDLFVVQPDNWGMQFLIRTGSAEFSKYMLTQFNKLGCHSEGGYPVKENEKLCFFEEEDVFEYLGLEWIAPSDRSI